MKINHCIILLMLATLVAGTATAQTKRNFNERGNDRFAIKIEPFMGGYVMASSNLKEINPHGPTGIHLGIEFPRRSSVRGSSI